MFCQKQENVQSLKLSKQNRAKLLYLFVSKIFNIEKDLSCLICFEVFNQPVKLNGCCHIFCENCIVTYSKYSSTTLLCPICQQPFVCNKLIPLAYLQNISLSIINAVEEIKHLTGTSNEIPTFSKILEMEETLMSQFFESQAINAVSSFDYSAILNAKKLLICSDNTVLKHKNVLPNDSENILFRQKSKKIVDPFDVLKQTEDYSNKIVIKNKQNFTSSVANKEVVEWLQDDRNKFDYKSPSDGATDTQLFDFNMPSISQVGVRNKQKDLKTNLVKKDNSKNGVLTRTLECVVKNVKTKSELIRRANALSSNNDVIVIEQINSEEDVIVINNPILKKVAAKVTHSYTTRSHSKTKRFNEDLGKLSKWNNVKQIKKALKEPSRKKSKLTVISRHSSSDLLNQQQKSNASETEDNCNSNDATNLSKKTRNKQEQQISCVPIDEENAIKPLSEINNLNVDVTKKTGRLLKPNNIETEASFKEINCVSLEKEKSTTQSVQKDQLSKNDGIKIPTLNEKEDIIADKENQNEIRRFVETEKIEKKESSSIKPELKVLNESTKSNIQEKEFKTSSFNIENVPNHPNKEDNDDDKFFNRPTQAMGGDVCISQDMFENNETAFIQNQIGSIYRILRNLGRNSIKQDLFDSFTSIKEILKAIEETVVKKENSMSQKHVGMQTDVCDSPGGFRISSTEMFNIQPTADSYVQTDKFTCLKCDSFLTDNTNKDACTGTVEENVDSKVHVAVRKCEKANVIAEVTKSVSTGRSKSFKRARVSSENNSDCEILPKYISKNKYVQDDLSLYFVCEPPLSIKPTNSKSPENLSCEVVVVEDKIYGGNLEMHDENMDLIVVKDVPEEPPRKRLKSQDAINECNMIIKEACTMPMTIEHTEKFVSDIHLEKERVGATVLTLALLEDEFNHNFDESQKKVRENQLEERPTVLNKSKVCKSLFADDNDDMKLIADCVNEIEDTTENCKKTNINILQNIVIKNAAFENNEEIERAADEDDDDTTDLHISISSDEVFNSETDVVNTTPQKSKTPSLELISTLPDIHNNTDSKEVDENDVLSLSIFNETFIPPPEFQDRAPDDIGNNEKTVIQANEEQDSKPETLLETQQSQRESISYSDFVKKCPLITSTPSVENPRRILTANEKLYENLKSPYATGIIKSKTTPRSIQAINTNTPKKTLERKKPWIACTRMSKEQLSTISTLSLKKLIIYSNTFNGNVTHMIINVDNNQCALDHTMKYVSAVAAGIWVLNFDWVEECLQLNTIAPEEPFEVLDISKVDGPKQSRLNRLKTPLLKNYKIYVAAPFKSTTVEEIENVILLLGGSLVSSLEQLVPKEDKICLIVADGAALEDFNQFDVWLEKFKIITVELEWLSRSVGQFKIVSIFPYMLCSDDYISTLDYPKELIDSSIVVSNN